MYRLTIATMLVLAIAVGGYTQTSRLTTNSSSPSYGKEQADRGKALYSRYCSKCHLENLKGSCPSEDLSSTSYICAATGSAPPLTGASFMHRFHSAGDLYSRVKWTMPADKAGSLSVEDNLSLVSYLLQTNGLPAGPEDLKAGTAMKSMVLAKDAPANRGSSAPERLNSLGISQPTTPKTRPSGERPTSMRHVACAIPLIQRVRTARWIPLPGWDGIAALSTRTVCSSVTHGWRPPPAFPDARSAGIRSPICTIKLERPSLPMMSPASVRRNIWTSLPTS